MKIPDQYVTGIFGLTGALIGGTLTMLSNVALFRLNRSWQRQQWTADNKRIEYRELIAILSRSAHTISNYLPNFGFEGMRVPPSEHRLHREQAALEGKIVIEDRILIAERMQNEDFVNGWELVTGTEDATEFFQNWKRFHDRIVKAAKEDLNN